MNMVESRLLVYCLSRLIGVALAALIGIVTWGLCATADPVTAAADPVGRVTFDDEFDGPPGAPPDPRRWRPDIGGSGWGNGELQFYTRHGNVFLDGQGRLVIEARPASSDLNCWYGRCEYSSGKITTLGTFAQTYGRFEARMQAPAEPGLLPAFWMLGENITAVGYPAAGEIDIIETVGQDVDGVHQHAHGPEFDFGSTFRLPAGQTITDWHTYAVEWSPDRIDWIVDGAVTRTLRREDAGGGWVFDRPAFMLLDVAVGGDDPGPPNEQSRFPARLLIDYVRCTLPGD